MLEGWNEKAKSLDVVSSVVQTSSESVVQPVHLLAEREHLLFLVACGTTMTANKETVKLLLLLIETSE